MLYPRDQIWSHVGPADRPMCDPVSGHGPVCAVPRLHGALTAECNTGHR